MFLFGRYDSVIIIVVIVILVISRHVIIVIVDVIDSTSVRCFAFEVS